MQMLKNIHAERDNSFPIAWESSLYEPIKILLRDLRIEDLTRAYRSC